MAPDAATPSPRQVRTALAALDRAYSKAAATIEAVPDHQRALDAATTLRDRLQTFATDTSGLRARLARRIWQAESLSLAALADRIGVSKARADQLIRATNPPAKEN